MRKNVSLDTKVLSILKSEFRWKYKLKTLLALATCKSGTYLTEYWADDNLVNKSHPAINQVVKRLIHKTNDQVVQFWQNKITV